MTLKNWQIKVLEDSVINYNEWINHVETCGIFPKPEEIVNNKINVCFNKMNGVNPVDDDSANEEMVNLVISKEGYKNRYERDNYKPPVDLEVLKVQKVKILRESNRQRIIAVYDGDEQRSIIGLLDVYTLEDKDTMNAFISPRLTEYREIKAQLLACTSIEEAEAININLI